MNLGRVGGILEAKKIASIAEVFYAQIAPHLYNGPIGAIASMHVSAASPNFLIQESIGTWGGFHADVLTSPIEWHEGYMLPPTEPGLGFELNYDFIESLSPYSSRKLHLHMKDKPYSFKDDC